MSFFFSRLRHRLPRTLGGFITIQAYSESGWMRRFRLPKPAIVVSVILVTLLGLSAALSLVRVARGRLAHARIVTLEQENASLLSVLRGQALQISRLKMEMGRLRDLERSLRTASGLDVEGQGGSPEVRPQPPKGHALP